MKNTNEEDPRKKKQQRRSKAHEGKKKSRTHEGRRRIRNGGKRSRNAKRKKKQKNGAAKSDSYGRVTFFYRQKGKGIFALSLGLLGVLAKMLGAQSNPLNFQLNKPKN